NPGKLVGFAGVNPLWGQIAAYEAERCAKQGIKGIGELHPDTQNFSVTDAAVLKPLMEVARKHNLIVTTHTSEPVGHSYVGKGKTTPERVVKLIDNHPDITFILAHWGGGLPFYALMPEIGKVFKNVYVDTAASPYLYDSRVFKTVSTVIGPDKILLGSDYPLLPHSRLRAHLDESSLPDTAKSAILGGNAANLLNLS
ncbi:MAG: amidohydrolase family protein, partial [Chloroflexi bacterium]|nr:amidohydrolase family protein [Chloroflexota bacterium]